MKDADSIAGQITALIILREARILVDAVLPGVVGSGAVDVTDHVMRMMLNVICEAAMGQDLGIQQRADCSAASEYTRGVSRVSQILVARVVRMLTNARLSGRASHA